DHIINLTTHTTYGVPGFIQDAGEFALKQGDTLEDEISAPFRRRHADAMHRLTSRGVAVVPSTASMYVMADIRPTGLSGEDFAHRLLDTHHIAVMPGESFGRAAAGHLRIALTVADDRLHTALDTLTDLYANLTEKAA
ncbi:MAG: aminotransferase class I/II-fold pyridoxal phosphate-dependent enzyme, partial [Pseudomonadota bacterium]